MTIPLTKASALVPIKITPKKNIVRKHKNPKFFSNLSSFYSPNLLINDQTKQTKFCARFRKAKCSNRLPSGPNLFVDLKKRIKKDQKQ